MIKIKIKSIILLISLFTLSVNAQREERNLNIQADSTLRFQGIIPPVDFQYNLNELYGNPILKQLEEDVLFNDNPSTIWLRTELLVSNQNDSFGRNEINFHFTSPLYQQYLKDSEFDMFRYILGAAQVSAVAYMAYRHVKKYGFWK